MSLSEESPAKRARLTRRPLIVAGILLGLGQGGFFDGIVLHQILQWHHMFTNIKTSTTVGGLELNTLGDGLFHAVDWILTLSGIVVLWLAGKRNDAPWSTKTFLGAILIGGGMFNVVEGIIDHHILQLHHVKSGSNQLAWDLAFIAVGLLCTVVGGWLLALASSEQIESE